MSWYEIRYEHLFVDGTKIEANANKYSFVWKKSVTKYEIKLHAKIQQNRTGTQLFQKLSA